MCLHGGLLTLDLPSRALEQAAKLADWERLGKVVGGGIAGGLVGKTLGVGVNAMLPDMPQDPLDWENLIAPLGGTIVGSNIGQHVVRSTFDPRAARSLSNPSNLPAIAAGLH